MLPLRNGSWLNARSAVTVRWLPCTISKRAPGMCEATVSGDPANVSLSPVSTNVDGDLPAQLGASADLREGETVRCSRLTELGIGSVELFEGLDHDSTTGR